MMPAIGGKRDAEQDQEAGEFRPGMPPAASRLPNTPSSRVTTPPVDLAAEHGC